MNSNKFPENFRESFGIKDKYGNIYGDIIRSFLHLKRVTFTELNRGYIADPSDKVTTLYKIHTDFKTYKKITEDGNAACIISFQKRHNGNFAMVRLYKEYYK